MAEREKERERDGSLFFSFFQNELYTLVCAHDYFQYRSELRWTVCVRTEPVGLGFPLRVGN